VYRVLKARCSVSGLIGQVYPKMVLINFLSTCVRVQHVDGAPRKAPWDSHKQQPGADGSYTPRTVYRDYADAEK
jgi:hypothetical protein